ncbi:hypothetical protein SAMN04489844_0051 [Nocardioides exalbidus]|uniref:Uncharacterized protein n=1 Tax=Nocardioides exalbidus TaxID=402596 RepID=A0A1H4I3E8_9ACTN|nr:hypothetical protein [Nocardioides exalbidus]SEB28604.1 hypothetical protein SAMN04489844_0051 [Nocardioides exalbidus]
MGEEHWSLQHDGHEHVVTIAQGALVRSVVWTRDDAELGRKKTSDETIVVTSTDGGAVRLKFPMVGPARRVTLHESEAAAHTGLGGTDLEPEAGSKAAARAEWIGAHPHLHTARQTALAAAGVGVPILLVWLLTLVPWPSLDIPWPDIDLPSIPWPSIPWPSIPWPSIPWPDINLPSIPWPDLPSLPAWTEPVRKFAIPILIAFFIARGEVKRRRKAEEEKVGEKAALGRESRGDSRASAPTDPTP